MKHKRLSWFTVTRLQVYYVLCKFFFYYTQCSIYFYMKKDINIKIQPLFHRLHWKWKASAMCVRQRTIRSSSMVQVDQEKENDRDRWQTSTRTKYIVHMFVCLLKDYIVPPSENNAIFIMTNFIETDQNRSQCTESTALPEAKCRRDRDCQNREFLPNANGRWTGRCLPVKDKIYGNVTKKRAKGLCEIQGR
jgi:hypothetical protein